MNSRRPQPPKSSAEDEVNQILQAAQDELLLNLSVNSHTVSNSDLDPDLSRRFLDLKSRPSSVPTPAPLQLPRSSETPSGHVQLPVDDALKEVLGDDLSARFAALRGSLSSDCSIARPAAPGMDRSAMEVEEEDEEDEVEKLLRWAKDAARLDPSPPSDDEVDDDDSAGASSSDSDCDVENDKKKGKSQKPK